MTLPAPTYDLVLLLDPKAEETARAKIVADTRASIAARVSAMIFARTPSSVCGSSSSTRSYVGAGRVMSLRRTG